MSKQSEYIDFSEILNLLKKSYLKVRNFKYLEHSLFGLIAVLALFLRTRNISLLKGKYLVGLDPYYYFRQAKEIINQGFLTSPDLFRNPPIGHEPSLDFFPYFMAYWSKFLSLFGLNQEMAHIIYPPAIMLISLIPFYLFVKNVFGKKIGLISALLLSIIPGYIFRTGSGFADHESLAMLFVFSALYFFSRGLDFKSNKKYVYGIAAGLFTWLMAMSWSAYPFLVITISLFYLFKFFFSKIDLRYYLTWVLTFSILLILFGKFDISNYGILIALATLFILVINRVISDFDFKMPTQVSSVIIAIFVGLTINYIFKIIDLTSLVFNLLNAGGSSKVDFTTSEVSRAFVMSGNSYFSNYGYLIFISILGLFLLSSVIFGKLKKSNRLILTSLTVGSVTLVMLGNWSYSISIMQDLYLQFLASVGIIFILYYSYLYQSNQIEKVQNLANPKLLLILSLFITSGLLARTATRFLFLFGPAVVILSAYALNELYIHSKKLKFGPIVAIIVFAILSFNLAEISYNQNSRTGSGLPGQWESSMMFLDSSTSEDSIIAHWWDYGYWTQSVGNRASVQDGGKPGGGFMIYTLARYGMTHTDPIESLEYFKAHGTTHLLYSPEEIGKYGAFSYLGSDKNDDRKSMIGMFGLSAINEVRSGNKLTYQGNWQLDDTLIDGKKIILPGQGYISEINVYVDDVGVYAPATVKIIASNYVNEFEIGCIYLHDTKFIFEENELNSCVKVIPNSNGGNRNDLGGALYLSEKVKDGLFTKLYIHSEQIEGYSQIYYDNIPLSFFKGRLMGPIKIWKLDYPNNLNNVDRFLDEAKLPEFKENYIL